MHRIPLLLVVTFALALPPARAQTVLYINGPQATGANTGTSWPDAFRGEDALQLALEAAAPLTAGGQTVQLWIAAATYTPSARTIPGDPVFATFTLQSRLELYGGFAGNESNLEQRDPGANVTTLSGVLGPNPFDKVMHVVTTPGVDSTCIVDGLTITGGWAWAASPRGGGIYNVGGSPTVRRCTIRNNATHYANSGAGIEEGGGVYSSGGAPRFEDCVFLLNRSERGGALNGDATLIRCLFDSNYGTSMYGAGGAICGNCTITQCSFRNNYGK